MNINIVCGNWFFPGWKNVDFQKQGTTQEFIDYEIDLSQNTSFPFKDNSVDLIYSSACIHLLPTYENVENVLNECYRILKPSGMMRLNCIDEGLFLNYYPPDNEHIVWIDSAVISSMLYSCGFERICFMDTRHSHKPVFCLPLFFRNDTLFFFQIDVFKKEVL